MTKLLVMKSLRGYIPMLFSLGILCTACKKDKADTTDPVIQILLPVSGTFYNTFDTIPVSATLTDETNLKRIEVVLRDQNGAAVQEGIVKDISGTSYTLNIELELYEYLLPSGSYSIDLSLNDGTNTAVKSIPINITESPTIKKGYYFVSKNASQHTYKRTDTNYVQISSITHTGTFEGSAISSYYQQLYTASGINQNFRTYNMNNGVVKWTLSNSASIPNVTTCVSDGKNVYLGKNDGNVYKYNKDGTLVKAFSNSETDYYVKHLYWCDTYVVANLFNFVTSDKKTIVFENATGIVRKVIYNTEVKAAFLKSYNELYLVSNTTSGQAVIEVLTLPGGSLYQSITLGNYEAYSACLLNSNTLLISTAEGKIWYYQHSNTNSISVMNGLQAKRMKYSERFNELYIAADKNFYVYQVGSFSLTQKSNYTQSDTIADFQVIFNK